MLVVCLNNSSRQNSITKNSWERKDKCMSIQPYNMSTLNVNIINVSCTLGISNTERRKVGCDLEQHLKDYI